MAKILAHDIFLSYYGDDFTGSTDVMESLALNGIPTALFLEAPEKEEVEQFRLKLAVGAKDGDHSLKAFGVAGIARSWSPEKMQVELPAIFSKIRQIPSEFFQYKICSTFDSSPEIGNIGCAVDIAMKYFPSSIIPLIVGAPFLNRFVVFGNLFARVHDTTYRLDRHPTMSKHPVTPMNESDLIQHMQLQTDREFELWDVFRLNGEYGDTAEAFTKLPTHEGKFVLFDTLTVEHLNTIGSLLIDHARQRPQAIIGSSGADYALAFHLQRLKLIKPVKATISPGRAEHMIVVTGSCAPATQGQIEYMEQLGHPGIRMNSLKLIQPSQREEEIHQIFTMADSAIREGQVPIVYTAKGPEDPFFLQTKELLSKRESSDRDTGKLLAGAQGIIIQQLIERWGKLRVVVAGGDTSGYVSKTLGLYALETLCPMAPGVPLCIAHSKDPRYDGLEICLKGGQNGNEKFFSSILEGKYLQ